MHDRLLEEGDSLDKIKEIFICEHTLVDEKCIKCGKKFPVEKVIATTEVVMEDPPLKKKKSNKGL